MQRPTDRVRTQLREATRVVHESLHEDAILSSLTSPEISEERYLLALDLFHAVYGAVEANRERMAFRPEFSLVHECNALRRDICHSRIERLHFQFASEAQLLGGLYVAHGSGFGRIIFMKNIQRALPHSRQAFLSLKVSSDNWRRLLSAMEQESADGFALQEIIRGAKLTFASMSQASRDAIKKLDLRIRLT